jgi:hypothetical protein
MKDMTRIIFSVLVVGFLSGQGYCVSLPDDNLTPGTLCSESDPNFSEYRYPAHVAYCTRNVSTAEKEKVAADYGVPRADWSKYEFDHLIPLAAGGSDDATNIWPQPLAEAHLKDVVEQDVYNKLKNGDIDQAQAIQEIHDWFTQQKLQKAADMQDNSENL